MRWKCIQRHKRGRKGSSRIVSLWPARNAARGRTSLEGLAAAFLLAIELRNLLGVTACNHAVIKPGSVAKRAEASQNPAGRVNNFSGIEQQWRFFKPRTSSGESGAVFVLALLCTWMLC